MRIRSLLKKLISLPLPKQAADYEPDKFKIDVAVYVLIIGFVTLSGYILIVNTNLLKESIFSVVKTPDDAGIEELDFIIDDTVPGDPDSRPKTILLAGNSEETTANTGELKTFWKLSPNDKEYHVLENKDVFNISNHNDKIIKASFSGDDRFLFCTKAGAFITVHKNRGIIEIKNQPLFLTDNNTIKSIVDLKEYKEQTESRYILLIDNDDFIPIIYDSVSHNFTLITFYDPDLDRHSQRKLLQVWDQNNKQHTFVLGREKAYHIELDDNTLSIKILDKISEVDDFHYIRDNNKYLFIENNLCILDTENKDRVLTMTVTDKQMILNEQRFSIYTNSDDILYEVQYGDKNILITGKRKINRLDICYIYDRVLYKWEEIEIKQKSPDHSTHSIKRVIPFKQGFVFILVDGHNNVNNLYYLDPRSEEVIEIMRNRGQNIRFISADRNDILFYTVNTGSIQYNTLTFPYKPYASDSEPGLKTLYVQSPHNLKANDIRVLKENEDALYFYEQEGQGCRIYKMNIHNFMIDEIAVIKGIPVDCFVDENNLIVYTGMEQTKTACFFKPNSPFFNGSRPIQLLYTKKIYTGDKIVFFNKDRVFITSLNGNVEFESQNIYEMPDNQYLLTSGEDNYLLNIYSKNLKKVASHYKILSVTDNYVFTERDQKLYVLEKQNLSSITHALLTSSLEEQSVFSKLIFKYNDKNNLIYEDAGGFLYILSFDEYILSLFDFKKRLSIQSDSSFIPQDFYLLKENRESKFIVEGGDIIRFYKVNKNKNLIDVDSNKPYSFNNVPEFKINNNIFWGDFINHYYYKNDIESSGNIIKKDCKKNPLDYSIHIGNQAKIILDPESFTVFMFSNQSFYEYPSKKEEIFYKQITISGESYFIYINNNNIHLYKYRDYYKEYIGTLVKTFFEKDLLYMHFLHSKQNKNLFIKSTDPGWTTYVITGEFNLQSELLGKKVKPTDKNNIIKQFMVDINDKYNKWQADLHYENKTISMDILAKGNIVKYMYLDINGITVEQIKDSYYTNVDVSALKKKVKVFYVAGVFYMTQDNKYNVIQKKANLCYVPDIHSAFIDNRLYSDHAFERTGSVFYNNVFNIFYINGRIFHYSNYNDNIDHFFSIESSDFSIKNISKLILDYTYNNPQILSSLHELPILFNEDSFFIFNDGIYFKKQKENLFFTADKNIKTMSEYDYNKAYNSYILKNTERMELFSSLIENITDNPHKFIDTHQHVDLLMRNKDFFRNKSSPKIAFINNHIILTKQDVHKISVDTANNQYKDYDPSMQRGEIHSIPIYRHSSESDFRIKNNTLYHKTNKYDDISYENFNITVTNESSSFILEKTFTFTKELKSNPIKTTRFQLPQLFLEYEKDDTLVQVFSYEHRSSINKRIESFKTTQTESAEHSQLFSLMEKELLKQKTGFLFDPIEKDLIKKQIEDEKNLFDERFNQSSEHYYFKEYSKYYYFFPERGPILTVKKLTSPYYNVFLYLSKFMSLFYVLLIGFILFSILCCILFRIIISKKEYSKVLNKS